MLYKSKTFNETQFYVRQSAKDPWQRVPRREGEPLGPSIDEQVSAWVEETGNEIVNPGVLSLNREYGTEASIQFLCVTLSIVMLFLSRAPSTHGQPEPAPDE